MWSNILNKLNMTLWWNGGARRQRAHHQHSAAPLTAFQREFVRKSGSGSRSVGRGWEDMILPGREDPRNVGQSEWDQKMRKMECIIRCMIRWYEMRSIYPGVSRIYTPRRSAHLRYPCISVRLRRPVHLHHPCISVHPPSLPSAKLSGGGGEKRIFPPQRYSGNGNSFDGYLFMPDLSQCEL
jgi:hypothetical protein